MIHKSRSNVKVDTEVIKALVKDGALFDQPEVNNSRRYNIESSKVILRIREDIQPGISSDSDDYIVIRLPQNHHIVKLLQRIRDESHRFAVSYHTHLKRSGQVKSLLDDIPGVGPATRKKLIKTFGSVDGIKKASMSEIATVTGRIKAKTIKAHLK